MARLSCTLLAVLFAAYSAGANTTKPELFSPFLRRFVAEKSFRESRTLMPLKVHVGSRCEADVKTEEWNEAELAKWFNPPKSGRELRRDALSRHFEYRRGEVRMHHFMEEADSYLILYIFQLRNDQWFLVEYHDESC
jgi:hypothetical protein